MKAEADSQIGTAGFLDRIMSQREVRNHKKRDCLFSTANNSTPEKKAQPCWLWEKSSSGILNIFHTPWWIMPEDFVGKWSTEETTLQSLSLYSQGLWKLYKYEPLLHCPKPTCRPADMTNSSMATPHNYYASLPLSFGISSCQSCQSGLNGRWTRMTSRDWKRWSKVIDPVTKLWTRTARHYSHPRHSQRPHWVPTHELTNLRLLHSHTVVCCANPWTQEHNIAKFPLPHLKCCPASARSSKNKLPRNWQLPACWSAGEGAWASEAQQLLWSPELKFPKRETFDWTTQNGVQEARPQATLNPWALFFFQVAHT